MFKSLLSVLFLCTFTICAHAQNPRNGTYTYAVAFAEWQGKSLGATCTVVIRGDSIKVIHNGTGRLSGKKGDILDRGILLQHQPTGKWIIGHSPQDKNAKEIGGCSDGPAVIDLKNKKWWTC